MRAQLVAVLLLLVAHKHVCDARQLRQLAMQCPDQLENPVQNYMKSAKYKDAVAKACVKRAKPDCYIECACTAFSTVGAVLEFEGRRNPALYGKHKSACLDALVDQAKTVVPLHARQALDSKLCGNKINDWSKRHEQAGSEASACPALSDVIKERLAQRVPAKP